MNSKPTILITGGTGMIGTALSKLLLQKGYEVIILTRNEPQPPSLSFGGQRTTDQRQQGPSIHYAHWNIEEQTIDEEAIMKADHIIHLAGANIGEKRWTAKRKKEIADSRTKSSSLLVKALKEIRNEVKTVVSASAIGWYGEDGPQKKPFLEDAPAAEGFLGETCKAWEESIEPVKKLSKRLVKLRTGIVLSNRGGALPEFKKPLNFGIATILGNGKQIMSWIHIEDLCRLYCFAIENNELHGAVNAVSPHPIQSKTLVIELAKKLRGKFYIPMYVPAFLLKIVLGELSIEVLKSTTVSNQKIRQAGFNYIYPTIESSLSHLTKES